MSQRKVWKTDFEQKAKPYVKLGGTQQNLTWSVLPQDKSIQYNKFQVNTSKDDRENCLESLEN